MSRSHVCSSDFTNTSVGGQDDDRSEIALKSSIQVGEALDIEHVDLIDEQDTWNKLSNTVIYVFVDDFVDFKSEFLGDFGFLWSVDLTHQRKEIVTTLRTSVGHIEIVEGDVLNDFFLFVDISFWNWNILFSFEIILGGVGV